MKMIYFDLKKGKAVFVSGAKERKFNEILCFCSKEETLFPGIFIHRN